MVFIFSVPLAMLLAMAERFSRFSRSIISRFSDMLDAFSSVADRSASDFSTLALFLSFNTWLRPVRTVSSVASVSTSWCFIGPMVFLITSDSPPLCNPFNVSPFSAQHAAWHQDDIHFGIGHQAFAGCYFCYRVFGETVFFFHLEAYYDASEAFLREFDVRHKSYRYAVYLDRAARLQSSGRRVDSIVMVVGAEQVASFYEIIPPDECHEYGETDKPYFKFSFEFQNVSYVLL